ncbi:serine kinase/phosphatase [Pseudomonas sp. gcc21]|uniref:serine kinase/phosphatase n=1 Tax=Pseudomonas sp. gcc21 TaxID=2726989 RepID=UPI0014513707|nr:serine kinase/phosphatase [Pseudomonas sp. gcc21]
MKARDEKRDPDRTTDQIAVDEDIDEVSVPEDEPMGPIGKVPTEDEAIDRAAEAGLTEASQPGEGPTMDDATPETLLPDDGSRSPLEAGDGEVPADQDFSVVDEEDIGAGDGLDEAELGRVKPLDGKPWDGEEK